MDDVADLAFCFMPFDKDRNKLRVPFSVKGIRATSTEAGDGEEGASEVGAVNCIDDDDAVVPERFNMPFWVSMSLSCSSLSPRTRPAAMNLAIADSPDEVGT